jgi:hypothetical protein
MIMPGVYNVLDYGAVGDGIHDDTAGIQAAVDAALGGPPGSVARLAKGTVYLPPGQYQVTGPIKIYSVLHLTFRGEGKSTRLCPIGAMPAVLDLNGTAFCTFEKLRIEGDSATGRIENVVYSYYDGTTAGRTTSGCVFRDIQIQGIPFVTGLRVGLWGSNSQCDTDKFENITVTGNYNPAVPTELYQNGVVIGSGVFGNNCIHTLENVSVVGCNNGFWVAATNFCLTGGSMGANGTDFRVDSLSYILIQGIRSEESQRLFWAGTGPNLMVGNVTLADIIFEGDKLHPDRGLIASNYNGNLSLRNIQVGSGNPNPRLFYSPIARGTIHLDGFSCYGSLSELLMGVGTLVEVNVTGFVEMVLPDGIDATRASVTRGLVTTGPLRFGTAGAGVIDGHDGTIQLNVEPGSGPGGTRFGDGNGHVAAWLTPDGAMSLAPVADAAVPPNSFFVGSDHGNQPCFKDGLGSVSVLTAPSTPPPVIDVHKVTGDLLVTGNLTVSGGVTAGGAFKGGSLDLGGGRKWDATGWYLMPGCYWTTDGLYVSILKWANQCVLVGGPKESLRSIGWSGYATGTQRVTWLVPPLP